MSDVTTLQQAAATGQEATAADPNTMVSSMTTTATPRSTADVGGLQGLGTAPANSAAVASAAATPDASGNAIAQEHTDFVDEWAKAPSSQPPVRTWLDASAQQTPEGQYLQAWYDQPATPAGGTPDAATTPAPATGTTAPAVSQEEKNATAIHQMQEAAKPVVPATPAAPQYDGNTPSGVADYFNGF